MLQGKLEKEFQSSLDAFLEPATAIECENIPCVSEDTINIAKKFIQSLPQDIEAPDVSTQLDGAIALEWYENADKIISFSIYPDGKIYYVAIIDEDRYKGEATLPYDFVFDLILKVIGHNPDVPESKN